MAKDNMDLCSTMEFEFSESWDQRRFLKKYRHIADRDGPVAAKRFELVLSLGERVQQRMLTSEKTLANVFNFVMDQIAKEEQLSAIDRARLTDEFVKYSAHGGRLNIELKLRIEQRQAIKYNAEANQKAAFHDVPDVDVYPDSGDDQNNIRNTGYSVSREAGIF